MSNEFNIQVGIKLSDNGDELLKQWEKVKKQISEDKISISFGDTINTNIKQIAQISDKIINLNNEINKINNNKLNINTNDFTNRIQKTVTTIEELKSGLSSFGKVVINSKDIDKTDNQIKQLIATVEMAGQKIKLLYKGINESNRNEGQSPNIIGYQFEGIESIVDNTDKILKKHAEDETKNEQKIQQAISSTIRLREQENKVLENKQAKASNKILDENYDQIQNFTNKSNLLLDKMQEKFKGLYSNLDFSKIKDEMSNLLPSDNELDSKFTNISNKIKQLNSELTEIQRVKNLGENVGSFDSGLNIDSSYKDIDNYLKQMVSHKASITSMSKAVGDLRERIKTVNFTINEGNGIISKYKLHIDESTKSSYKMADGLNNISSRHATFSQQLKESISGIIRFTVAGTALFGTLSKLKEGYEFINELSKAQTNIQMINTDMSSSQIKELTKQYSELAGQMHSTVQEVMSSAEEYLRAGKTVEESQTMIRNSITMSKISAQSQKEVSEEMIAAMNAFGFSADQMSKEYVDKISALDSASASSSKDISEAIMHTAKSAQLAGVSWDYLLSSVTSVMDVTKKPGSEVGNAFRTIFSRMEAISKGQKDEDGTDINQVEKSLNKVGIALRKNEKEWRSMEDVLKDVQARWSTFDSVTKSDIASKIGGTYQKETILTLMENQQKVKDLMVVTENSIGSSDKKIEIYAKSTDARLNDLKHSWENLYMSMYNSDTINSVIGGLGSVVDLLTQLTTTSKSAGVEVLALGTTIILLIKNFSKLSTGAEFINTISKLGKGIASAGASLITFATNPVTLAILLLGGLSAVVISHAKHQADLEKQTNSLKKSFDSLNTAMKSNDIDGMKNSTSGLKEIQNQYKDLLDQRKKLEDRIKNVDKLDMSDMEKSTASNVMAKQLADVNKKIEEQANSWEKAGYTIDRTTGSIKELSQAENLVTNNDVVSSIKAKAQAEIDNKNEIISCAREYQSLNAEENKSASQKQRLSELSETLSSKIGGLIVSKDKEGNTTITNTKLLDKEIQMLNTEGITVDKLISGKSNQAKQDAIIETGKTKVVYSEVSKRIAMLEKEANMFKDQANKIRSNDDKLLTNDIKNSMKKSGAYDLYSNNLFDQMAKEKMDEIENIKSAKTEIDEIYNSTTKGIDKTTDSLNNGYIPANEDATKATDRNTIAINNSKDAIRNYDNALKSLDNTIYKLEINMSNMDDTSQTYRDSIAKEIKLLEQKNKTLNDGISIAKNQVNTLGKLPKTSTTSTSSSSSSNAKGGYSSADGFINDIMPYAQSVKEKYNVPVSLLLAQAMSESTNGTSYLARTDNNYFGMTWTGKNGQKGSARPKAEGGNYVHYNSMEESVDAYGRLLANYYGINGDSFDSGLQKVVNKGYAASPNYKQLVQSKYNQYNLGKYDTGTYKGSSSSSSSISSENSVETQIDSLVSKIEEYEKGKIDNTQKIEELKILGLNSQMKDYDKQISQTDLQISASKTNADLYNEGTQQKTQYLTEQWRAINERYALMAKKEQALESAIKSGNYTEKTVVDLKNQLAEIKNEGLSTVKELHDAFTEAFDAQYSSKVSGNKENIEEIQWQLDNLNEKSADASKRKYELNKSLLEQQEQMKKKTLEQMKIVEEMLAKEKYDSTKQVWINQLDQLKVSLREMEQSTEQITSNMESFLSSMQSSIESLQSNIVSALKAQYNDEIQALQEKINILQNDTPDKENRLSALQKELKEWEKDDSQFSKSKQSELKSEIEKVNKELQIADLQSQIKQKQDESEDSKLNKEAIKIMKRGDTTEINNLLEEWLPEYKNKFDLFGDDYKMTIAEQTKKQLSEFKNFSSIAEDIRAKMYELNNESYTPNSSSTSNSSSKVEHNEDGTVGTISENDYGTEFVTYTYNGQERSVQAGSVFDPNSPNFIGYASGGETQQKGLHWLDGVVGMPERVLSAEQTSSFNDLVYNQLPKLESLNLDKLLTLNIPLPSFSNLVPNIPLPDFSKLIPKSQINLDQPLVKNEITNYNNTPFDVENNMNNFERMLKQQVGSRLGFIG